MRDLGRAVGGAGPVMLIGGAEDKVRDKLILSRFATFAGGPGGHVVVIATASSLGDVATERYRELFEGLGIGSSPACVRRSGRRPRIPRSPPP